MGRRAQIPSATYNNANSWVRPKEKPASVPTESRNQNHIEQPRSVEKSTTEADGRLELAPPQFNTTVALSSLGPECEGSVSSGGTTPASVNNKGHDKLTLEKCAKRDEGVHSGEVAIGNAPHDKKPFAAANDSIRGVDDHSVPTAMQRQGRNKLIKKGSTDKKAEQESSEIYNGNVAVSSLSVSYCGGVSKNVDETSEVAMKKLGKHKLILNRGSDLSDVNASAIETKNAKAHGYGRNPGVPVRPARALVAGTARRSSGLGHWCV